MMVESFKNKNTYQSCFSNYLIELSFCLTIPVRIGGADS